MRLRGRKLCAVILSGVMCAGMLCQPKFNVAVDAATTPVVTEIPGTTRVEKKMDSSFLSVTGFAKGKVNDRSQYAEGSDEYAVVTNELEFFEAIEGAQSGDIKVIELRADLYLGWNELSEDVLDLYGDALVEAYKDSLFLTGAPISNPSMIESGVSTVTLSKINGLTIFSQTGNKIRHAEIKLNSSVNDLVLRNLEFTDVWDWDDRRSTGYGSTGALGSTKRTGWSYIKINGAKNVWIDHCNFGVSYDGNVDIENGSNGISITWCNIGDTDYSEGSMLNKTATYLEELYQQNKKDDNVGSFIMYTIMRDNGMSPQDIMKYMGHHKKCHLGGGGDTDSWWFDKQSETLMDKIDPSRTNANEYLRMTFAYNNWTNIGSRIPLLRGGVGHLFNCYVDNTELKDAREQMYNLKNSEGKNIRQQIEEVGGATHFLFRGMNARNGASIAADTNVYYNFDEPMIGDERDSYASYAKLFGYNHSLIVNSKVTNTRGKTYTGSSWDNNGENLLAANYGWTDKSTINHWSWGQEGDKLSYEYQTFPLEDVEKNVKTYGGAYTLDMTAEEWLKTEYDATKELKLVDKSKEVPIETIELSKTEATLFIQEEFLQLDAKVTPSNTTEKAATFKWTSSDESVAVVKGSGLVLPKASGETIITVETSGGLKAECKVTVGNLATKLKITNIPEIIYVGDIFQLTVTTTPQNLFNDDMEWNNEGTRLTVVDEANGIFRADKAGSNPISVAPAEQGNRIKSKEIDVRTTLKFVEPDVYVTGVDVVSELAVEVGASKALNAAVVPADATNQRLLYEISDDTVATVDAAGNVVGVATGEAVVTVTSVNGGYSKTCTIKVGKIDVPNPPTPPVVYKLGDVNVDGAVNLTDAQITLKAALKIEELDGVANLAADVDKNGKVELADAQKILRVALKIDSFDEE